MNTIEYWRNEIDSIEQQLIEIINRRAQCAVEIGAIKRAKGLPIYDPKREEEILERVANRNQGPLPDEDLKKIFFSIIETTRNFEDLHSRPQK